MVVNNENVCMADVVFLIESTAHISPYVESLKTMYIMPTLEYFSGSQADEVDYGTEANPNSTLYGIVTFMANDCRPDSATGCFAPTSNASTALQWFDKIPFIGGGGNASSHVVEGLATAIHLFDDLRTFRGQSLPSEVVPKTSKHCILICNSEPYYEPVMESKVYGGKTIDELMKIMAEKGINFSVFSPRKIPFLYKIFEGAGASSATALTKNYAKDRRHLILLNGFHLQEKPMSPSSQPPALLEQHSLKRPLSPSSTTPILSNPQLRNPQLNSLISNVPIEANQFTPQQQQQQQQQPGMGIPRGGSPWPANGNVPSPGQPRNPTHINVRPRSATPQQMATPASIQSMNHPSPGQLPNLVSQPSPVSKPVAQNSLNPGNVQLRPNNPNLNQLRPQQMHSPFSNQPVPSPSQPQPSPMGMRAVPSPIGASAPSPISQPQQFIQQQQINQINQQHLSPMAQGTVSTMSGQPAVLGGPGTPGNGNMPNMGQSMAPSSMMTGQRTRIWMGVIEYHDKVPAPAYKSLYLLDCTITYQSQPHDPEFKSTKWPDKLLINTVPKTLINRLSPIFKNNSFHINFHFSSDSPGLKKLITAMSANSVGCIQLPNQANVRIIICLYMPEKKMFVGFIPHNQDEFMNSMKELIETHKKEQQVKMSQQQKMLSMNMQMNLGQQQQQQQQHQLQQQQQQQQGQSVSVSVSQATSSAQAQMVAMNGGPGGGGVGSGPAGQLSLQLSHGQLGQSPVSSVGSPLMAISGGNTMYQVQHQMGGSPGMPVNSIGMSGNGGNGPSGQMPAMSQAPGAPGSAPGGGGAGGTGGGSVLLSQTLTAASQPKNAVFLGNNANMITTSSAGLQMTLNAQSNAGIGGMQQQQPPASISAQQQAIMQQQQQQQQQNVPNQQGAPGPGGQQQFNSMMASQNSAQLQNMAQAAGSAGAGGGAGGSNAPTGRIGPGGIFVQDQQRQQNLMTIKQLQQNLEEAQKREQEYQHQLQQKAAAGQPPPDGPPPSQQQQQHPSMGGQMMANAPPQGPPQQNNAVRQHLQHQLQQKQIHMQQAQQQQHQQAQQQQQQHQVMQGNNSLQLRHLLQQQQQMRGGTMNPSRMQTSVGVAGGQQTAQQNQQHQQMLLQQQHQQHQQGGPMGQQQQQFRFQASLQQQQRAGPGAQQQQQQQQHGQQTFYDEGF